ncbi:helix-turn-helix domain-containing protein [Streptomonospora salina]|uniref:AraC-like DNA-binding protein n=1 Tax=Streptomonospora salina TaxID=104205 RepID=A0A841EB63_9ACTN|nr:helix-turn-helix domain-containing protein [Streptomonospora salina]MBB5998278.1 AraC-like DNA-binding protein [Streptomonospora salina]
MTRYTPAAVPGDLAGDLLLHWSARIEGRQRLVPDGCVDLLWTEGGRVVVCGPETTGWTFSLGGGAVAAGVRFRPGRAGPLLGMDTADARERRVPIEDVLGSGERRRLLERLGGARTDTERVAVLEDLVRRRQRGAPPADPVAAAVVGMLSADPATPVAVLAAETGLSERQLHRRCTSAFGYGPALLRRILRLQRFLRLARRPAAPADLAGLAHDAGFTDQSHLHRECRDLGGAGPHELTGRPAARGGGHGGSGPPGALGAGAGPALVSDPYMTARGVAGENRGYGHIESGYRTGRRALSQAGR